MNNFVSVFEELSKLYEEAPKTEQDEDVVEESCVKEELTEAADEDIIEDEIPEEEVPAEESIEDDEIEIVDDEPKQTIIECSKCGALVIVDDVKVDEESDLVNIDDECKFCEEKEGYKIVGSVVPYEVVEDAEDVIDSEDADETPVVDEEPEEVEIFDEDEIIDEDLGDFFRKTFDKPASIATQQAWEDELNGECGEISDERRAHLERKFAQQRDWEARHEKDDEEDDLDEFLNVPIKMPINITANDNNVAVGGLTS